MRKTFEYIYPPPRQKDLKEISSFLNSKCWVFIQILYVGQLNTCHKGDKNNLNCKSSSFENDNICAIQFLVLSSFTYNPQNSYLLLNNFSLKICVKDKVMCKKIQRNIFYSCENRCQTGSTEVHCISNCKCQNGAGCNTQTGECSCKPGWKVNNLHINIFYEKSCV